MLERLTTRMLKNTASSVAILAVWTICNIASLPAQAQELAPATTKLTAPALFPERTLAYLRVDNVKEMKEAFGRSTMGKLSGDEKIKPILMEFYGSLVNSTEAIREYTGLNLEEMLSIPTGELAIAMLPSDQMQARSRTRRNDAGNQEVVVELNQPCVAVMMDAGEEISGVQVLLERMQAQLPAEMQHSETKFGSLTLHRYSNPDKIEEQFGYFIDQGVFVGCSSLVALDRLAKKWSGQAVDWPSLAENRQFTSIMGRCVGTQGERPHASFYVDPLALIRQVSPANATSTMVFAVLPTLGLNDIQAIGGSVILSPPDFDSINHFHVLLGSPRRAILALLRPKTGSITPENWVPASVASYSTINWDASSTVKGVEQLYNQFRGDNALQTEVFDRVSKRLDLDFRKDILENLEGRFTMIQGFTRPVRINSGSNVYAIRLKNPESFNKNVLPKLMAQVEKNQPVTNENFGPLRAYVFQPGRGRNSENIRQPEICVTMIDDYVLLSDSKYMMNELATCIGAPDDRLSESIEFQMISDRIKAQLQGKECSALTYSRPEESLQMFYELARDPGNREKLRGMAANNGFFTALLAALDKHDLPEFSVISKYLAPTGGFLVEEDTGLHYMAFGLRRE